MRWFPQFGIFTVLFSSLFFLTSSCAVKEGQHWFGSLGMGEARIYISGPNAASNNYTITMYETDGTFIKEIYDYGTTVEYGRGLAYFDPFSLLVAVEGTDRLDKIDIFGNVTTFAVNALLTGNLFDLERDNSGNFYVVESNTIERFNSTGERFPVSGNPYINTTIGSCVLNTPHGMTITSAGRLAVVNSGGTDNLSVYDISTTTASCASNVAFGQDPWDVVAHPNGYLYVVTQLNDSIYRVNEDGSGATIIYTYSVGTANPAAIAVLPDGNLIVADTGSDQIDLFSPSGTLLVSPFIRNTHTTNISDLLVLGGQ